MFRERDEYRIVEDLAFLYTFHKNQRSSFFILNTHFLGKCWPKWLLVSKYL